MPAFPCSSSPAAPCFSPGSRSISPRRSELAGAVEVNRVWKKFRVYREKHPTLKEAVLRGRRGRYEDFWALADVSLGVGQGESVGIIGRNGSGKSTLLKLVARILFPERGSLLVPRRVATLLELGAGFQMDYTGVENIYLNGAILGLSRQQIAERLDQIVAFAELEHFINNPVRNYSSGMYMRLGFSIAINVDPQLMLIDEVLAVGDEAFQRKCLDKIRQFRREGRTIIFVSHDLGAVAQVCDRVIWLDHGKVQADGAPPAAIDAYLSHVTATAASLASDKDAPVRLHGLRFLGPNGETAFQLRTGQPMSIDMDYEFVERLARPIFGISVFRNDGVYCFGFNTDWDAVRIDGRPHRGHIELLLPELNLLSGGYDLTLTVFDSFSKPLLVHHKQYSFRVTADEVRAEGVVNLPHRWALRI